MTPEDIIERTRAEFRPDAVRRLQEEFNALLRAETFELTERQNARIEAQRARYGARFTEDLMKAHQGAELAEQHYREWDALEQRHQQLRDQLWEAQGRSHVLVRRPEVRR